MEKTIKAQKIIITILLLINIIMSLAGYKLQIKVKELEKENESLINIDNRRK